jgi:hypothetical protein
VGTLRLNIQKDARGSFSSLTIFQLPAGLQEKLRGREEGALQEVGHMAWWGLRW